MERSVLYFLLMLFLHVFADYTLQGILSSMKQKDWWERQIPDFNNSKYKNDYKAALLAHSYMWSFVVMLPISITAFVTSELRLIMLSSSLIILMSYGHYVIDDSKANNKTINLIVDQLMHVIQLILAWAYWTFVVGGW